MKRIILLLFILGTVSLIATDSIVLPIFSIPRFDLKNEIVEVFYNKTEKNSKLEITVVFKDEDHPCFLADILYDLYRYFKYGRIKDIETFFLHYSYDESLKGIEFPGVYAGDHRFSDTKDLHGSAYFQANEVEFINGRPIIYINTWNHMFGIKRSFCKENEILINDYPASIGTRADAEVTYSWRY